MQPRFHLVGAGPSPPATTARFRFGKAGRDQPGPFRLMIEGNHPIIEADGQARAPASVLPPKARKGEPVRRGKYTIAVPRLPGAGALVNSSHLAQESLLGRCYFTAVAWFCHSQESPVQGLILHIVFA